MFRTMMKSKIHRARVTEANLNYIGSITIDEEIIEMVGILPHEKVQIVNNNNGARLETYVIAGKRGSKVFCLNGAAARLVQPNDIIIVVSYGLFSADELTTFKPKVAVMDKDNNVKQILEQEPPLSSL
ncbi:aspartate 1-decarboxylase [Gracilibacillus boraciitolerans JCM 21714]|uniref:Aspartate 1-decarboxylase n=1 Tax=Gracilibacillus boraciitolerans JCM 21714 TaxID=1298598 RepID=W4VF48_9BACI|nr:aspartate 1-decarboxylase [Gracilibacillus boraciitolerans]GAE91394.1 aspartate 1-decarboxylase [Gracilibacillus boraciitolerans JCM 21714]